MRLDTSTVANLVASSLPLSDWGFTESVRFVSVADPIIIFNSQWCRVKFLIEREMTKDFLRISYGRLHALDSSWIMHWNGENHYCWHSHPFDIRFMLEFLDGTSPQNAYKRRWTPFPFFEDYSNSKFAKSIDSLEERNLKLHSAIWEHYGLRFFELLDLRRPDLWEQYLDFLKECFKPKNSGSEKDGYPPEHRRC